MNTKLKRVRIQRNKALVKWRQARKRNDPQAPYQVEAVKIGKKYKKLQNEEISKAFIKHQVHNLRDGNLSINDLWRSMKNRRKQDTLLLKDDAGRPFDEEERKVRVEMHFRTLGNREATDAPPLQTLVQPDLADPPPCLMPIQKQVELNQPVGIEEVHTAIRKLKNCKATLDHDIPNEFIKKGGGS